MTRKVYNELYPPQVWFTTVLASSFLLMVFIVTKDLPVFHITISDILSIFLFITIISAISIPALILYWILFNYFERKTSSSVFKPLMLLIGTGTLFFSYYLLTLIFEGSSFFFDFDLRVFPIIHIPSFIIISIFLKLKEN